MPSKASGIGAASPRRGELATQRAAGDATSSAKAEQTISKRVLTFQHLLRVTMHSAMLRCRPLSSLRRTASAPQSSSDLRLAYRTPDSARYGNEWKHPLSAIGKDRSQAPSRPASADAAGDRLAGAIENGRACSRLACRIAARRVAARPASPRTWDGFLAQQPQLALP